MKPEPKLVSSTTKEDAIKLVESVFQSMGGRMLPPRRPRHIDKYEILTIERDNFMMDFENACLSQNWDSSRRAHPKGPNRHKDPEWAAMIQSQVYPHHSDVDWEEYVQWSSVHGDEYFIEDNDSSSEEAFQEIEREEQAFLPGYLEAQTRLRTSYLSTDMVRPLSTSLDDRIVTMAGIVNGGG